MTRRLGIDRADVDPQAFAIALIERREQPHAPAVVQRVRHEVGGPGAIQHRGRHQRLGVVYPFEQSSLSLGIPLGSLSEYERGTRIPNDKDLEAMAAVYGHAPHDLLREAVMADPKVEQPA